jgi:hypothetical protein
MPDRDKQDFVDKHLVDWKGYCNEKVEAKTTIVRVKSSIEIEICFEALKNVFINNEMS